MRRLPARRLGTTSLTCLLGCAALGAALAHTVPPMSGPPAASAVTAFRELPATAQTLRALRAGGHVLYLRHGPTDNSRADAAPITDFNDCGAQRVLSDEGRQAAAQVGAALRQAGIALGEIRVSPLCRTRQTLEAAFGRERPHTVDLALRYMGNMTTEEKQPVLAQTRRLLSAPVPAGGNRLLIAHGPNLADLMGYFPKEGTLVVFRPRAEAGFEYVASIPVAQWPQLLRAVQQQQQRP